MKSKSWAYLLPLLAAIAVAPVLFATDAVAGDEEINPDESIGWQGFTGLFNVVSPDTLDQGHISFGMLHRNYDRELTDLDQNDLYAAFAVGITDRVEFGFSYSAWRQVDYDDPYTMPVYNNMPNSIHTIEDGSGDLLLGVKVAIKRVEDGGAGLSVFGNVKLPVGDEDVGLGTGGTDLMFGAAMGYDARPLSVFGNVGFTYKGDARLPLVEENLDLGNMFTYGVGVELGSHNWIRGVAELSGETVFGTDMVGDQQGAMDMVLGFKLGGAQHGGVTLGGGWQRNLLMDSTIDGSPSRPTGWVAELSYTSYTPPAPPIPPPPPKMNNDPRASLTISPQQVYPIWSPKVHQATATCVASDPDGDPLRYTWDHSGGQLKGGGASTTWTPPEDVESGRYQITCRVADGQGGTAQARGDITVVPDPEHPKGIGKAFFEFDRYDLDAQDEAVLGRVAKHLRANPTLRVTIEGHTCYIATEEYNLALGQHRAAAIRDYLVGAGIAETRMETVSYGEGRPWKDNSREVTRRLNRRGEFVFSFAPMM